MKIMITGASGLLGRALMREFAGHPDFSVVGLAFSRASEPLIKVNLLDTDAVAAVIAREKPYCIIHAAAERRPDICEGDSDGTWRLNVTATENLAAMAQKAEAFVLYMSTDYVFDGTRPPYKPLDTPNPLNLYGRSKLEGERAVQQFSSASIILRVPILYGPVEKLDESPVTVIAQSLKRSPVMHADNWALRHPTHIRDVASVCRQVLERRAKDPAFGGILHWSSDETLTKYTMALEIARVLGIPTDKITPNNEPTAGAPRPRDSRLDCSHLESLIAGARTSFAEGIQETLAVPSPVPR